MLWWDDLLKNIPAMNSNNYTQEGQVEGQVNDQQVNTQKGGLGSKDFKVSKGEVTFGDFRYEVGKDNSTYISGKYRLGGLEDDLAKVNSEEDLKALLNRLIEEKKERDKEKEQPKNYSKKSIDQLQVILNDVLQALGEKTNKSPEELCKGAQDAWEKRELEKALKEEKETEEAWQKAKERKEALQAKQANK